jgi:hypothetical protein
MLQPLQARALAFYLPQFHPIPENDAWWGKGFTEWTNVAKAKPLFRGHHQPHLPADLGFYDLRVPETRVAQAELAQCYGVEGFCYWHYWFGNGRRILERPFQEVLTSGEPDFPFCLAWANESWTGHWYGAPKRMLIEQTYPGRTDYVNHFFDILDALTDDRYITVEGKPLVVIFKPAAIPDSCEFTDCWRELAVSVGLKGLYLVAHVWGQRMDWQPATHGYDAACINLLAPAFQQFRRVKFYYLEALSRRVVRRSGREIQAAVFRQPRVMRYENAIKQALCQLSPDVVEHPIICSNWDNTPRSGAYGNVLHDSTPELFRLHVRRAVQMLQDRPHDQRLLFVKSWNEWAEGNYLEPDHRFGHGYLRVLHEELCRSEPVPEAVAKWATRV